MAERFTFYEFFCGGGMARVGLGAEWRCLFANDIDPKKGAAYRENFGDADLVIEDVARLTVDALPGRADLAWASFPCQDLSLAGPGGGLHARRSGAFWPFIGLVERLRAEGRAPRTLVIENVCGLLTSRGGQDMAALREALSAAGYRHAHFVLDAERFVPQSRPRLFVVAVDAASAPSRIALRLPDPEPRRSVLADLVDLSDQAGWDAPDRTARLLALMGPKHRAKLDDARREAKRLGRPVVGTAFRRTRADGSRLEARFDGVAGCLRTPAGGSSRQVLLAVWPDGATRTRLLSGREAARLMGLGEDYKVPARANDALKLFGDGVAPPAVRHLAAHLLEPLLRELDRARRAA